MFSGSCTGGNTLLCLGVRNSAGCLNWFSQLFVVNVYKPSNDGVLLFVSLAIYYFTLACSTLNKLIKKKTTKQANNKNRHGAHTFNIRTWETEAGKFHDGLVYTVTFRLARAT